MSNVKDEAQYVGYRNKACRIITVGMSGFDYRKGEDELPTTGAWCRECAEESAKPIYPIYMNCKPAYVLECPKCGSTYPMYVSMYRQRYIGRNTKNGGQINPTHGKTNIFGAMNRKAKSDYNDARNKAKEEVMRVFNMTQEDYEKYAKERDERHKKDKKRAERRESEFRAKFADERRQMESDERKRLIENGTLKYVKNIGLVNTETGQVVKL